MDRVLVRRLRDVRSGSFRYCERSDEDEREKRHKSHRTGRGRRRTL